MRGGRVAPPLVRISGSDRSQLEKFDAVCRDARPSVSIVIPTRDKADLLKECLQSLFERTSYGNFDVVLVDNDSAEPQALKLIQDFEAAHERLKVVRFPGDFNFSRLSNAGAQACAGEFLLFLNNDTQIISPDWIERLLYFARQPDKGAVGASFSIRTAGRNMSACSSGWAGSPAISARGWMNPSRGGGAAISRRMRFQP
ncbi:glycosyltransferase family 2 protein [Methylocystis sp. S23]